MKKNMVEFISVMSNNDVSVLDHIIEHKYRKFTKLYWLLKDFSDFIASLKYNESEENTLKLEILVSKKLDVDKMIRCIKANSSEEYPVIIRNKRNKITIEITQDENE